jgi:hypothetical protein
MAAARELVIGDEPAAWERLGFAPGADGALALGGLRVRLAGSGAVELRVADLAADRPDGLPVVAARDDIPPLPAAPHPNGASAIDHVVVFTDDRDRTAAALAAAGGDVRRRGDPPELPAPMAFVRFGELVVEVAQAGGPARFWGVTIVVPDVDALAGPLLGTARPAVQPGRRIATVSRDAGLSIAVALITPR